MGVTAKVIDWCVGELFSAGSESVSTGRWAGWIGLSGSENGLK
jgi:hypothetical protein